MTTDGILSISTILLIVLTLKAVKTKMVELAVIPVPVKTQFGVSSSLDVHR